MRIWRVMDDCIRTGVHTPETTLPGRLRLRRRAPMLYRRLMRGFYPGLSTPHFAAIGAGSAMDGKPAGSIDAPDFARPGLAGFGPYTSTAQETQPQSSAHDQSVSRKSARATRVVGQLDHAILPEPPVSCLLIDGRHDTLMRLTTR